LREPLTRSDRRTLGAPGNKSIERDVLGHGPRNDSLGKHACDARASPKTREIREQHPGTAVEVQAWTKTA
jgi:hypothetical protein